MESKCNDLETASGEEVARVLVTEESKRVQLHEEIRQLEHKNVELQDKVQEILVETSEKMSLLKEQSIQMMSERVAMSCCH